MLLDAPVDVQDFYERYPYPPPVESLEQYRSLWANGQRRRHDRHLLWPARPYRDDQSILVAGCGTSQAAKYAIRWPAARVTGIDFSAHSVRCTEELKRKYDLENLEVRQLPIERVAELATMFDHVVCTGVLHHLADPVEGLRALRAVLEPDGAMLLMVYAPYGRAGIYMMQDFCRRVGLRPTEQGIRDLTAVLGTLAPGHPLERLVRDASDFNGTEGIADALLHPRDRAYSVSELFEFLKLGGLTFGRWVRQAPYSPTCGALSRVPFASRLAQLPPVEQFAAVELFRGTMVRHSVIALRDDNLNHQRQITFDGDAYLHYVPVRTSDTICVQERLSPGTAAVLINRHHTGTDISLPLDDHEKSWFDAIDGERTIGQINPAHGIRVTRRAFFERLWWHDQVVFDASRTQRSAVQASHAVLVTTPARADMIWIPGGEFRMGSDDFYPEEAPAHDVSVDGFWMDRFTVTNEQFARFVAATNYVTLAERSLDPAAFPGAPIENLVPGSLVFHGTAAPVDLRDYTNWWTWTPGASWNHPNGPDSTLDGIEHHPVVHVAYEDAEAYARWAGKELPTEAEWEFAARGGLEGKKYVWGDEAFPGAVAMANTWQGQFPWENLLVDGYAGTSPVGSFPANAFGLYDMAGNVWEWTCDWFVPRHGAEIVKSCCGPAVNPRIVSPDKSYDPRQPQFRIPRRVVKGGSHLCAPNYCLRYRPAARQPQMIDTSMSHIGFRCIVRNEKSTPVNAG